MKNELLTDDRTNAGELLLAVRIAKQLAAIKTAGVLDEALDWCRRRLAEHRDELIKAAEGDRLFCEFGGGSDPLVKAMAGLGVANAHTIVAAVWCATGCERQRLIIDELNNFISYYKITTDLPVFPVRRKKRAG